MFAICIRAGGICPGVPGLLGIRPPPRDPFAEADIIPVRWGIVSRSCRVIPGVLGVLQRSPRVVIRRNGLLCVTPDEMRSGCGTGLDLVLGAAELLHSDLMIR